MSKTAAQIAEIRGDFLFLLDAADKNWLNDSVTLRQHEKRLNICLRSHEKSYTSTARDLDSGWIATRILINSVVNKRIEWKKIPGRENQAAPVCAHKNYLLNLLVLQFCQKCPNKIVKWLGFRQIRGIKMLAYTTSGMEPVVDASYSVEY